MEEEISLKELYQIFKKHFFTMITAVLIGAVVSVVFMIFFVTPKYSSEAQLLVNQQGDASQATIQNNEIQANIQLINTYSDILTGHSVLNQVNENLENQYSVDILKKATSVNQSQNSQAFNVTVVMETAEEAQIILNEIINVFETTIQEVYDNNVTSIYVLSPASYNSNKVSPSLTMYILIGALLGLIVSLIIVLIIELMDTTVKDEEFLTQQGIINLGRVYELSPKELKQTRLVNRNKNQSQSRIREKV